MSKDREPSNPEIYKTYNPNWEPWITEEELQRPRQVKYFKIEERSE